MLDINKYREAKEAKKIRLEPLEQGNVKVITETFSPATGEKLDDVESDVNVIQLMAQRQEVLNQNEQYAKAYEENEKTVALLDELITDVQDAISGKSLIPAIKKARKQSPEA